MSKHCKPRFSLMITQSARFRLAAIIGRAVFLLRAPIRWCRKWQDWLGVRADKRKMRKIEQVVGDRSVIMNIDITGNEIFLHGTAHRKAMCVGNRLIDTQIQVCGSDSPTGAGAKNV